MSLAGILLGLINIAIVIAVLIIIGLIIEWVMGWLGLPVPAQIRKVFLIIVALIALYMLVALMLGLPSVRFLAGLADLAIAVLSAGTAADHA